MLLEEALKAGISAIEFWRMTPFEVYAAIAVENWRRHERHTELRSIIWQLALLQRQERLPKLEDFIAPPRTQELTPEEAAQHKAEHQKMINALPERFRQNGEHRG